MFKVLATVPPIIFVSMCVFAFVAHRLYREFGWEQFLFVGASPQLKGGRESGRRC
jgi:hypothetical protein